jgi:hypothetical protein
MSQFAASIAIVVSAVIAQGQDDPTGTWKWDVEFNGKTTTSTLKLKLDGGRLAGIYIGGASGAETPIQDTSFNDGKFTFTVKRDNGEFKTTVEYSGIVKGDTIDGKVISTTDRNGNIQSSSRDWQAKRQK